MWNCTCCVSASFSPLISSNEWKDRQEWLLLSFGLKLQQKNVFVNLSVSAAEREYRVRFSGMATSSNPFQICATSDLFAHFYISNSVYVGFDLVLYMALHIPIALVYQNDCAAEFTHMKNKYIYQSKNTCQFIIAIIGNYYSLDIY